MAELENPEVMRKAITLLSSILQRVCEANDVNGRSRPPRISVFNGVNTAPISIESYLERIFTYSRCSPSCLIVAYIYLDRFSQKQPFFPINSLSVHRLLITSVMVSAKFMDDIFYNNAFYARVGGVGTVEMNMLEMDFLFGLEFELNVTTTEFYAYCSCIQREKMLICPPLCQLPPSTTPGNGNGRPQDLHRCAADDESVHQQQLVV